MSLPILNRGYEENTDNWAGQASATIQRVTDNPRWGVGACEVDTPGSDTFEGIIQSAAVLDIEPETQHTLSVYMRGGGAVLLFCQEANNSGGFVANRSTGELNLTGEWTRYSLTFTTSATTVRLRQFQVLTTASAQDVTFYVDGWQLDEASEAQTYDGPDFEEPTPEVLMFLSGEPVPGFDVEAENVTGSPPTFPVPHVSAGRNLVGAKEVSERFKEVIRGAAA